MRKLTLLAIFAALAGCATTSDVVSVGNGNYEIAGSSATALSSGGSERVKLMKKANDYCAASAKQAVLVDSTASNGHVGAMASAHGSAYDQSGSANYNAMAVQPGQKASADVIFRCE